MKNGVVTASWFPPYSFLCSRGAGENCTHIFPSHPTQPEHLADVRRGTLPWRRPLNAPGRGGRDGWGCPPVWSHAATLPHSRDGTFSHHRSDPSFKLAGEQQKNKRVFLSPGKFQHFEVWFGANLTGNSKLSVDNFGIVTSKDVSKY